jgi:hypothetical protein
MFLLHTASILSFLNPFHYIHIPDPLKYINPFYWLAKAINSLYNGLISDILKAVISPPTVSEGSWSDYLFGNALGLAGNIAMAVTVITICIAMLWQKRIANMLQAFAVAIFIGGGSTFYFAIIAAYTLLCQEIAKYVATLGPGSDIGGSAVAISNVFGYIIGVGAITSAGGLLLIVTYAFVVIGFLVKLFGLISLALSPLADSTQKILGWLVALGLVALGAGRLAAVLIITFFRVVDAHIGIIGSLSFTSSASLFLALLIAAGAEIALVVVFHKQWNNIRGRVNSVVRGQVNALVKKRHQAGMQGLGSGGVGTRFIVSTPTASPTQRAKGAAKSAAAAKIASSAHPAALALSAGIQAKKALNGPPQRTLIVQPERNDSSGH